MALFLLEAKAEDFPAFYEEYQKREDRSNDLNDLLFIAWTRVDPEAAVEASRGSDDFRYAYWAWACHDPGAALTAAIERGEGVGNVAWGIGEFHPEWLKENRELIPADQWHKAMQGLVKWPDAENPESTLRLISQSNIWIQSKADEKTLLALARKDPAHAFEVITELSQESSHYWSQQLLEKLITTVGRDEPSLLGVMAEQSKSPSIQNKLKLTQFKGLIREDLEAAKTMFESAPKSWLKDDMGITYLRKLMANDPDQGFGAALDFFKTDFGGFERYTWVRTEYGSSGSGQSDAGSGELLSDMLNRDGAALLDALLPDSASGVRSPVFSEASHRWAQQDMTAYADWLGNHRDNPEIYASGVLSIVNSLEQNGEYAAGMEWAQSVGNSREELDYQMRNLYRNWLRNDSDAAVTWRNSEKFTGDPALFPLPETIESE